MAALIAGIEFGGLLADKAFDANRIIAELNARKQKSSFTSIRDGASRSPSPWRSTSGGTSSKFFSANSKSPNASPCLAKRPIVGFNRDCSPYRRYSLAMNLDRT